MTLLVTLLGAVIMPIPMAHADDSDPAVGVAISTVSPSHLTDGAEVTLSGSVTNDNDHAWQKAQVYLVIPRLPFTTRAQVDEAINNPRAYAGERVVEAGTFAEIGDLAPGERKAFTVTVPYEKLGITGDQGIYPVGVQVLATDTDGTRSVDALARATTFLPLVAEDSAPVPTAIVWPFIMPDYRAANGDYHDPAALMASVGPGGQLRNLLDLAVSAGPAATAIIDPALLVGVDDLAASRHVPQAVQFTDEQQADATNFLNDLLVFTRGHSPWILDFDRPDDLALSLNPDLRRPLRSALSAATDAVLTQFQLSGRRITWPTRDGVTRSLLSDVRDTGDTPVIVSPAALEQWEPRLGSLVQHTATTGPMPLLVSAVAKPAGNGPGSVVALRQKMLTDAALAVLERAIDPQSRADAVVMVDPVWNPGPSSTGDPLSAVVNAPFTRAVGLDTMLTRPLASYEGGVPANAKARPLTRKQLTLAADMVTAGKLLTSATTDSDVVSTGLAFDVAGVLGVRWRSDRATAQAVASARLRQTRGELDKISIEAPSAVTLSSSKGGFPLTIINDSDDPITVGVNLDSTNPALTVPSVIPVEVGAGERRTLTVTVDLGRQQTAYLTAQLATSDGLSIGNPTTFKVRSSSIGVVLWVAMGLAGVLVLIAIARRLYRARKALTSTPLADTDD